MKLSVGYPDEAVEIEVLRGAALRSPDALEPVTDTATVGEMVAAGAAGAHRRPALHVRGPAGRRDPRPPAGPGRGQPARRDRADPGGAARTRSIDGRGYVLPEDLKALVEPVFAHRLLLSPDAQLRGVTAAEVLRDAVRVGAGAAARPGLTRVTASPHAGSALLAAGAAAARPPASGSATPSWPCSARPRSSRVLLAVGVRRVAAAAARRPAVADPDRVARGEPSADDADRPQHQPAAGRQPGRARPVRRPATVPVPLLRLRPGRDTTVDYPVPTERRGVVPVGPLRVARRDPLGLVVAGPRATARPPRSGCTRGSTCSRPCPAGHGPQPRRPGRPGAARHDHVRLAARVRGRRRAAPGALAHQRAGRRADGARAARHQPAHASWCCSTTAARRTRTRATAPPSRSRRPARRPRRSSPPPSARTCRSTLHLVVGGRSRRTGGPYLDCSPRPTLAPTATCAPPIAPAAAAARSATRWSS